MTASTRRSLRVCRLACGLWIGLMLTGHPAVAQGGPPAGSPQPKMRPQLEPSGGGPAMAPPSPGGPSGGGPLDDLARAEGDHVAVQVIADLAHAQAADVARIVRTWGPPTALRYFNVLPKAFHDAAQAKFVALIRGAQHDQLISDTDADRLMDQLQHAPDMPSPEGSTHG